MPELICFPNTILCTTFLTYVKSTAITWNFFSANFPDPLFSHRHLLSTGFLKYLNILLLLFFFQNQEEQTSWPILNAICKNMVCFFLGPPLTKQYGTCGCKPPKSTVCGRIPFKPTLQIRFLSVKNLLGASKINLLWQKFLFTSLHLPQLSKVLGWLKSVKTKCGTFAWWHSLFIF